MCWYFNSGKTWSACREWDIQNRIIILQILNVASAPQPPFSGYKYCWLLLEELTSDYTEPLFPDLKSKIYWKGYLLPVENKLFSRIKVCTQWKSPQSFPVHLSLHFQQPWTSLLVASRNWMHTSSCTSCDVLYYALKTCPQPPQLQNWAPVLLLGAEGLRDPAVLGYEALSKINEAGGKELWQVGVASDF